MRRGCPHHKPLGSRIVMPKGERADRLGPPMLRSPSEQVLVAVLTDVGLPSPSPGRLWKIISRDRRQFTVWLEAEERAGLGDDQRLMPFNRPAEVVEVRQIEDWPVAG